MAIESKDFFFKLLFLEAEDFELFFGLYILLDFLLTLWDFLLGSLDFNFLLRISNALEFFGLDLLLL